MWYIRYDLKKNIHEYVFQNKLNEGMVHENDNNHMVNGIDLVEYSSNNSFYLSNYLHFQMNFQM